MQWIVTDGIELEVGDEGFFFSSEPSIEGERIDLSPIGRSITVVIPDEPVRAIKAREAVLSLDMSAQEPVAAALEVAGWFRSHRFCSRCGDRARRHLQELAMLCDHCGHRNYPRLSPCVIVIVTKDDQVLLANHKRGNTPVYSVLAGFIEVGESAETAVIREVKEEAGIWVDDVSYVGSQSWPFPGQFMLAYHAKWKEGELKPDRTELADLQWFDKSALPLIPPPGTISRLMIERWLDGQLS
jgi:NAD+ diphosphatase